jgi:P27 family predicted phage terminase small subunit
MPAHVPPSMKSEWKKVCSDLIERRLLTDTAIQHVASYLFCQWQIKTYAKEVQREPLVKDTHGRVRPCPATGLLNKAFELHARYGSELGMSPAARSRYGLSIEPEDDSAALGL